MCLEFRLLQDSCDFSPGAGEHEYLYFGKFAFLMQSHQVNAQNDAQPGIVGCGV